MKPFSDGDEVDVTQDDVRERSTRIIKWRGEVMGRSVLGPGWYHVRATSGLPYTVHENEMTKRKR